MSRNTRMAMERTGAWIINSTTDTWPYDHWMDGGLASGIRCMLGGGSLIDVGAGVGEYGGYFAGCSASGVPSPTWEGIDGSPGIESISQTGPPGVLVKQVDLCQPVSSTFKKHDWVMSLEVGEHIPQPCLATYLATLDRLNRIGIVLSWARPFVQTGRGHVSPRLGPAVDHMMSFLGYENAPNATRALSQLALIHHLKMNIRVFLKVESILPPNLGAPARRAFVDRFERRASRQCSPMLSRSCVITALAKCSRDNSSSSGGSGKDSSGGKVPIVEQCACIHRSCGA